MDGWHHSEEKTNHALRKSRKDDYSIVLFSLVILVLERLSIMFLVSSNTDFHKNKPLYWKQSVYLIKRTTLKTDIVGLK